MVIEHGLKTVEDTPQREEAPQPREKKEFEDESQRLTFGAMLKARWESWKDARLPKEEQWLVNLRQFHNIYESDVNALIQDGRSKTYVGITRMKVMVAFSKLVEVEFPATGNKHWEINPTPEPTVKSQPATEPKSIDTGIEGAPQETTEKTESEQAAENMSIRIDDQLVEADYDVLFLDSLLECVILGSGCLKSTSAKIEQEFSWKKTGEENVWQFQPKESDSIKPLVEAPSVFDVYPDPNAASMKSAIGCYQRHVLNKHEFRNLKLLAGFKKEEIDEYLEKFPNGDHTDLPHEVERKKHAKHVFLIEEELRYDVLEYWGWVNGMDLSLMGVDIPEDERSKEYMAQVWIAGPEVIKAELDESYDEGINFFIFPYEKTPKQIFGRGIPEICADSQEILNAAARRLLDDVALLGPQIEINMDEVDKTEVKDLTKIFPFKIWPRIGGDSHDPLIRVHNLTSVSKELLEIMTVFRRFIDEETNLPTPFGGGGNQRQGGTGGKDSVGGTKMLLNASNVVGRSIIKNIDKYGIKPFITKLYNFNMQWSDDDEIKGDAKPNAMGSATLIQQEVQSTQLINLLNITNNPTDLAITKRPDMLRKVTENSGINPDDVIKTEEEIAALAQDPVKEQLNQLTIQKATLENQEIAARIDKEQSEVRKNEAAIKNDKELLRLKAIELKGKEIEAAANLELQEKKIAADVKAAKAKPIAGVKKTTTGLTNKTSKNDGLKTNNKGK
ncbi:MAG: portal protein [Candidatus Scalindua sp.]